MFSRTVGEVAGKFPQYVSADAPLAEASGPWPSGFGAVCSSAKTTSL
jgi:hypothetical protein